MNSKLVGALGLMLASGLLSEMVWAQACGTPVDAETAYLDEVDFRDDPYGPQAATRRVSVECWLQLQRSGARASTKPQLLSAQEKELANQRWLDSFTHPIPEFFKPDAAGKFTTE